MNKLAMSIVDGCVMGAMFTLGATWLVGIVETAKAVIGRNR